MNYHGNAPHLHLYRHVTNTLTEKKNEKMLKDRRSKDLMPRSKPDVRCKKHPKHLQSPGVCSICLSDKLSRLSTSSRSTTTTTMASCSSSSSLSAYSSSSASSCSSPVHRYHFASEAKGSVSFFMSSKSKNVLRKSRSVAFVPRMRAGEGGEGKKKGGFWSKLLGPRSKRRDEVLAHSRTVREGVTNRVQVH